MILESIGVNPGIHDTVKTMQDFIQEIRFCEYKIEMERKIVTDDILKIDYTIMREEFTGKQIIIDIFIKLVGINRPWHDAKYLLPTIPDASSDEDIYGRCYFVYGKKLCVIEDYGNLNGTYSLCTISDKNMKIIKRKYSDLSNLTEEEAMEIVSLCENRTVTQ